MRKSIFDLEIRVNVDKEFENISNILFQCDSLYYNNRWYSLYDFLNSEIFPIWKYKGLFVDFDDFIDKMNINLESNYCSEEKFLYLIELLINLWPIAINKLNLKLNKYFSSKVLGYMDISIPTIIEKLNYKIIDEDDKKKIIKRDADVDSILDTIPSNYVALLLDYNDIRNNNLNSKMDILKKLDLFIEANKDEYKSLDKVTYNAIQIIVNKMGINHPIKEEPFKSLMSNELLKWYDKCFKLMIHLIRRKEVNTINNQCKEFIKE